MANLATPEAALIDEFSRTSETEWDKFVRVDNVGNIPFIARIQAKEFMQLAVGASTDSWVSITNPSYGAPMSESATATAAMAAASTWPSSAIDTQTPWFYVADNQWTPHAGHGPDDPFAEFWRWIMPNVMTFEQWNAGGPNHRSANTWVLAEDGYFYYSSVVEADESSTDLFEGIEAQPDFHVSSMAFYYAIDLTMEVVTQDDAVIMRNGSDAEGRLTSNGIPLDAAGADGKVVIDAIDWEGGSPKPRNRMGWTDTVTLGSPLAATVDGIPVFRIASQGDYDLIVTKYVYHPNPALAFTGVDGPVFNAAGNGSYWLSNSASGSSPSAVSNLQSSMDTWWNNITPALYPTLNAAAIEADFGNGAGIIAGDVTLRNFGVETGLATQNAGSAANVTFTTFPQAQSRPSSPARNADATTNSATDGQGIVTFALSGTEILSYFPDGRTAASAYNDNVLGKIARGVAAGNHQASESMVARTWWSRSRGGDATMAGAIDTNGTAYGSWGALDSYGAWHAPYGPPVTNTNLGLRPALWVRR